MKKKLSILIMSSVIAVSFAGCQADTQSDDNSSQSSETSIVVSSDEDSNTVSLDESSDNTLSDESSDTVSSDEASENNDTSVDESISESSVETVEIEYITTLVSSATLSSEYMASKSFDLSKPAVFTVTSSDELDKFYEEYKDTYSLDNVESDLAFSEITDQVYGETYLDDHDLIIVIQQYDTDNGIEFTETYVEDSKLQIHVAKSTPSSAEKTAYSCSLVGILKSDRSNAEPVIIEDQPIIYDPDGENEIL